MTRPLSRVLTASALLISVICGVGLMLKGFALLGVALILWTLLGGVFWAAVYVGAAADRRQYRQEGRE